MSLVANRYAQALFDTAVDKKIVDGMYDDFTVVIDLFKTETSLMNLMLTPSMNTSEKKGLLGRIFEGSFNQYLKNFVNILLNKNRFGYLMEIYDDFREQCLDYKNMVEATVITAVPLREELEAKLKIKLEKRFNKKIMLNKKIDQSILGGAIVYVGEQIIDGSIKAQLNQMKTQMNNIRLQ
ncbi:MAG: F0F1 ATP synthase subunit delta [Eubacteriaceae bacterium]|nr:F0F1 ATP synthase subunit delta [Eubacteriaceae bacterium]